MPSGPLQHREKIMRKIESLLAICKCDYAIPKYVESQKLLLSEIERMTLIFASQFIGSPDVRRPLGKRNGFYEM